MIQKHYKQNSVQNIILRYYCITMLFCNVKIMTNILIDSITIDIQTYVN